MWILQAADMQPMVRLAISLCDRGFSVSTQDLWYDLVALIFITIGVKRKLNTLELKNRWLLFSPLWSLIRPTHSYIWPSICIKNINLDLILQDSYFYTYYNKNNSQNSTVNICCTKTHQLPDKSPLFSFIGREIHFVD